MLFSHILWGNMVCCTNSRDQASSPSLYRNHKETQQHLDAGCKTFKFLVLYILHHWFWIRGSLQIFYMYISQTIWGAAGYRRPINCTLRKLFTTSNAEGSETAVNPLDAHWEGCACHCTSSPHAKRLFAMVTWLHSTDFKKCNSSSMWP